MNMKGIVFDLDETLVDRRGSLDSYSQKLFSAFSESVVVPLDEFVAEFHRLDGNGRVPRDEFFAALAAALFRNVPTHRIKEHFEATAWLQPRLFGGIVDVLQALRAEGWRVGIVTNGGVPAQTAKIENSGLSNLIDSHVISAAFGSKKPAPEIFRHVIELLRIDPDQSWFVGDDPRADIWGAKQIGFQTCWVERYSVWPADLPRCYDARVTDTADILGVVARAVSRDRRG
jgi:putative hydrolase of the HAD superfamily